MPTTTRSMLIVFASALSLTTRLASAAPIASIVPRPQEVVETRLLPADLKASLRGLAAVQAPGEVDSEQRLAAARRMIEAGRSSGDPRALGYAESLLAPWPATAADAPVAAIVLHATIAQSRHEFERARTLLDRAIVRSTPGEPYFAQGLLTRATIALVTGKPEEARTDCAGLHRVAPDVSAVCSASVQLVTGSARPALAVLRAAALRTSGPVRAWALAVLAQGHEQLGEAEAAERAYRAALAAGDELVTRLALTDLLLRRGAHHAAFDLLRTAPPIDGVLLRRWLCAREPGEARTLEAQLRSRLTEARRRGDGSDLLHARDWARFELELGNRDEALRLARANWRAQREPSDLLILARAAHATGDTAAGEAIRAWLARFHLEDVRIAALLPGDGS